MRAWPQSMLRRSPKNSKESLSALLYHSQARRVFPRTFRYWAEIEVGVEMVDAPKLHENLISGEASLERALSA